MTLEGIQKEVNTIIIENYRNGKWYVAGAEATEEQTKEYQAKVRELRFKIQMITEADTVSKFLDEKVGDELQVKKLLPLVSRRKHPEFWMLIRKAFADGSLFTFSLFPLHLGVVCGCEEKDLAVWTWEDDVVPTKEQHAEYQHHVIDQRDKHNQSLVGIVKIADMDMQYNICKHPLEVKAHQNKHTIGNWNCKACLNSGTEIKTAEDIKGALQSVKSLEWCPRFFQILRHLPIKEYIETAGGQNICYAGLVHTEMSFIEEHEVENIPCADGLMESVKIKNYISIKKKCDSCNYSSEEKKEFEVPEQVHDNQVLQTV